MREKQSQKLNVLRAHFFSRPMFANATHWREITRNVTCLAWALVALFLMP